MVLKSEPTKITADDCAKCGLCCFAYAMERNRYIPLAEGDYERIPEKVRDKVTIPDVVIPGFIAMYDMRAGRRTFKKGPLAGQVEYGCKAFKGTPMVDGRCSIHEFKPKTCREYEVGGESCLKVRERFLENRENDEGTRV
jgi:Fe-S-cluster containining protein